MIKKNTDKKVIRALEELGKKISLGYTHENYVEITYLLRDLEYYLEIEELNFLKDCWRDSYTDSCNEKKLEREITKIKNRLE